MINRRIYYLSGFDPRGARYYHRLFREESKKSESNSGAEILTAKRVSLDETVTHWQIDSVWNQQQYKIDYRFLNWDDVMKHYWISSVWILILKSIPMYFKQIRIQLFSKFRKAGRGPFICSVYPLLFSVLSLLCTLLLGYLSHVLVSLITNIGLLAILMSVLGMFSFVNYAKRLGEKLGVWWILQTYFFISRWIESPLPELEIKLKTFAERIIRDQTELPVDEVILVGHCVGSMLTVQVMANILGMNHEKLNNKLTVMTIGQCIPYLSYALPASHFREKLEVFANNNYYSWFDMGARADPLCFQQVNPAIAEGVKLISDKVPYRFVVKPYEMFSPEKYKTLKQNKLRIHFQYLMAADIKTDFDYFEIITGPIAGIQKYKSN